MSRRPDDHAVPARPVLPTVRLARDHPDEVVRELLRTGTWERVGRGVYLPGTAVDVDRRRRVALARIVGIHQRLGADHWFSHESAALIWGLPLWRTPDTTHLSQQHRPGSNADRLITRHVGIPTPDQRTVMLGLPVTSLERTVLDCVSTLHPLRGLVIADAALRIAADRGALDDLLARRLGRRGSARARAVLSLADDGAESPGESAARFVVLRDGLPRPSTQVPVETRIGTFWADLGWPEWKVLLEYDGRSKYTGRETERFMQEKRRHDAVLETGHRVLRVTKEDLTGDALTRRVLPFAPSNTRLRPRRELRATTRPTRS